MYAREVPEAGRRKTALLMIGMAQKIEASILDPPPVSVLIGRAEQGIEAIHLLWSAQQQLDLLPVSLLNPAVLHAVQPTPTRSPNPVLGNAQLRTTNDLREGIPAFYKSASPSDLRAIARPAQLRYCDSAIKYV